MFYADQPSTADTDHDDTDHGPFEPLPFSLTCFGLIMAACFLLDRLGWL